MVFRRTRRGLDRSSSERQPPPLAGSESHVAALSPLDQALADHLRETEADPVSADIFRGMLEDNRGFLRGGGSRFVTETEGGLFEALLRRANTRRVFSLDCVQETSPDRVLRKLVEGSQETADGLHTSYPLSPLIIVYGFSRDNLDAHDPHTTFESYLRHHAQHQGWAVGLVGDGLRSEPGYGGSIFGSSTSSTAYSQQRREG